MAAEEDARFAGVCLDGHENICPAVTGSPVMRYRYYRNLFGIKRGGLLRITGRKLPTGFFLCKIRSRRQAIMIYYIVKTIAFQEETAT